MIRFSMIIVIRIMKKKYDETYDKLYTLCMLLYLCDQRDNSDYKN